MEDMRNSEILRLIEWLKAEGYDAEKILECIEYVSK